VDREERPDIDRIYQIAQQMLTQRSGGWPLTMFLTPDDQRPFFCGTLFPGYAALRHAVVRQVLERVAEYYREHETALREQSTAHCDLRRTQSACSNAGAKFRPCRLNLPDGGSPRPLMNAYGGSAALPKFPIPDHRAATRDWRATAVDAEPDCKALYMRP